MGTLGWRAFALLFLPRPAYYPRADVEFQRGYMPFSTYQRARVGAVAIEPQRPLVAGSFEEITITYTAGDFGIDDTGAIKVSWRTASDSSRPQFTDPRAPNYTTAVASNGARLALEYNRNNIRPWVSTLLVRVTNGFLRKGDTLTVKLGDRRGGWPGYRLQTAVEDKFFFKVFADAFATYDFVEVPNAALGGVGPRPARALQGHPADAAPRRPAVSPGRARGGPLGQCERQGRPQARAQAQPSRVRPASGSGLEARRRTACH